MRTWDYVLLSLVPAHRSSHVAGTHCRQSRPRTRPRANPAADVYASRCRYCDTPPADAWYPPAEDRGFAGIGTLEGIMSLEFPKIGTSEGCAQGRGLEKRITPHGRNEVEESTCGRVFPKFDVVQEISTRTREIGPPFQCEASRWNARFFSIHDF